MRNASEPPPPGGITHWRSVLAIGALAGPGAEL
jgi:hypothetical protein